MTLFDHPSTSKDHSPYGQRPCRSCGRPIARRQPHRMEQRLEECCYECAA